MFETVLIALSLAMDAFAVSISSGIAIPGFGKRQAIKMGVYFGAFQFGMPLIGWLLGSSVSAYIETVDHWIAFALLAFIGGRMVWEASTKGAGSAEAPPSLNAGRLLVLATATSIDALAVGVSMAFMQVNIVLSAIVIGIVTFGLAVMGGLLGRRLGTLFQRRAEIAGGLVLIAIGIKILWEHLFC